jgi:pimeloyl-ACP methyl ester carboxylesterase
MRDWLRGFARPAQLALAMLSAGGCSTEFYARQMISPAAPQRCVSAALLPASRRLLQAGRIDAHHRVPMPDGVEIDTWVIRRRCCGSQGPRGVVAVMHGYTSSRVQTLGIAERIAERGFDVVLWDHRAHGRSGGRYVTFGALEHRDAGRVVDRMIERGEVVDGPVYVFGISMGGAAAVQYAASEPRCRGCLAVVPFASFRRVARRIVPLMSEEKFQRSLAEAGRIGGFDPNVMTPQDAAARLGCPLMVVHGRMDWLVPYAHGRAIYDHAAGPRTMVTIPWADHFLILLGRDRWFAEQLDRLAREGDRWPR